MSLPAEDVTIGVVGDGFGALQIYVAAVYLGFAPEQIGIFGEQANPAHTYQQFAWNLGQTILRSESESHFLPADWPTFAELDAWARRDPSPLLRSALRKLNPGVPEILTELQTVTRELDYPSRVLGFRKVGWVVREPGPPAHFGLYDEEGELMGRAKHLALAIGHGPLSFPGVYGEARRDPVIGSRVVQAYEPKVYEPGQTYVVLGSGIAAVNEEVNVLQAGGKCISLRRNLEPDDQDLNVPRCLFDGSGIDAFEALSFEKRLDFLGEVLKGTAPNRANWAHEVSSAQKDGRYEEQVGELTAIGSGPKGLRITLSPHGGGRTMHLDVSGIVLATGFVKDYSAAAPAAAPGTGLRRSGRARADPSADQLRHSPAGSCGLATRLDGTERQHGRAQRRHDRRPQVHGPAVRRGCGSSRGAAPPPDRFARGHADEAGPSHRPRPAPRPQVQAARMRRKEVPETCVPRR